MNVLLLVSVMLVAAECDDLYRLQTYLDTAVVRIEYEQYMTIEERKEAEYLRDTKYALTKVKFRRP